MKDYTEIFAKAIMLKSDYNAKSVGQVINAQGDLNFGDFDEWVIEYWYLLSPKKITGHKEYYGYLSSEYPIALLSERCPDKLKNILDENKILHTKLEEPLSCDENILKQYVHHKMVFDESLFLNKCDFSFDDERFGMVLERLENGFQRYVDSGNFMLNEIRLG